MKNMTCTVCGAPINQKTHKCDYCGTSYQVEYDENLFRLIPIYKPCQVFKSGKLVDERMIQMLGEEKTSELVIKDIARNLADAIAPMMDIRTNYDREHCCQHIVGTIRVVGPDYRF